MILFAINRSVTFIKWLRTIPVFKSQAGFMAMDTNARLGIVYDSVI